LLAVVLLLASAWAAAWGQDAPVGGILAIHVGEGRLLHLDHAAQSVLVGDASIADVQVVAPTALYVYGRKPGQTTLTATDTSTGVAAQLTLRVDRNSAAAQAALPAGNAGIALRFDGNRILLSGPVGDLGQALDAAATARAYNAGPLPPLDRTQLAGAQQVTLRVRIAEVSRSSLDQLGVNWNVMASPGSFALGLVTGSFLNGSSTPAITGGISGLSGSGSFGQASAAVTTSRVNAEALVNALRGEGLLTMLAEPNLTTLSGETASFLAGGEIPIPVPQSFGVTTIQYKSFGVRLAFTPTLLPGNRIAMRVEPEVSQISSANAVTIDSTSVPAFITRRAQTNVEMASGQTIAIAGLFQRSDQDSLRKFPVLGDVPVLGALFRSTSFQRDETELVILITPFLTQPVSTPEAFPMPTDSPYRAVPTGVRAGFVVN
jgi:pilus assembly protein CpaC